MMEDKHIIWSNHNLDFKDYKYELSVLNPEKTENELLELMYETNNDCLSDERVNLDIQLSREIIVIADIGRWNGRFSGYKEITSGKIKDCLYSECDYNTWFVDKDGEFRCDAIHHDGTNHYLYRTYKDTATDEDIEELKDKIYFGTATKDDIERVTNSLGEEIAKVYGFNLSNQNVKTYER